ncbi:MAG: TRAM domain-containing protein, partial [Candidatus Omnitrophota bacterium]
NIQKDPSFDLRIHEEDIPHEENVDAKLVRLAKMIDARICTTDFNLSRTASIQGVQTLNLNELVNALKPMFFAGDELPVRLVREGKEPDQAVAYTEEGVMVVVSGARNLVGKTVTVQVASVLQTQSGRMVFAKIINGTAGK